MIASQKKRLFEWERDFVSIGITKDGEPLQVISVPWEKTCNAYSMRCPDVYLAPEDTSDADILSEILKHKVIGCYIWVPLEDYSFLSAFTSMRDLSVEYADNMTDLDFLRNFKSCELLFLHKARLKNLDAILDMKKNEDAIFSVFKCVGLCNCEVDDVSRFERERFDFSEFLIWRDTERDEKEKWRHVKANTKRYYDI